VKATLLIHDRHVMDDFMIVELVVWEVPVLGSSHGYKYRLYCGRDGERLVSYDNERGKGDHRHVGRREYAYAFVGLDDLLADFWADVDAMRRRG
jgi:hypothetical protein